MSTFAKQGIRQATVEATVIRADGMVQNLGVVAYWHWNPLRRLAWRIKQALRGRRAGSIKFTRR